MDSLKRSLTELANKYGSDKGTEGPSRHWPVHNYTDVYEAYLIGLRTRSINLLEVGLGVRGDSWDAQVAHGRNVRGGASMLMWHDYFPNAKIYGADIHEATFLDNDRITTFQVDQGNRDQLVEMAGQVDGGFDVIIDDGSHRADHQQITFGAVFPFLKPGGIYFIEDLMRNGRGDNQTGRFASPKVLNTRRLFRHFHYEREFLSPHGLGPNSEELATQIDYVAFHVPKLSFYTEIHSSLRGRTNHTLTPPTAVYEAGTEAIVAIRKRA
jgi:hypothetical protein